ncbi:NADPH-dependent F420 reductase [Novosphingobium aerophilum]|uniref:NADPH-dependent F420 reductase n=1 Tax=Novosphingobium pentaromativorans TaxID=205844 RepID=A0A2W5Q8A4_9SPHN|nr:NADPH-dependent F420 reductase [Novosphingobium sp. TCA1]PZQ53657.1 MAG: NADPH-dependent F420 reductase [Novosphingobium pentaromativorans]GFE75717.1 NADPH-dependent F420 reductase [Novosphingobium sp. TCA1]
MTQPSIAVVGGTGNLGAAIAWRLARAGYEVVIGSRNAQSAQDAASGLGHGLRGASNVDAVAGADIVIVTVPFAAQQSTLADIAPHVAGKLVVDTTVPLVPPKVMRVQLPDEGSAAMRAQAALGPSAVVVSAFHNVAAHKLAQDVDVGCDVLVFGDDKEARGRIVDLADAMGLRGLHGGALVNSAAAEALTSILIFMNKTYRVDGAGIRITGELIPPDQQ